MLHKCVNNETVEDSVDRGTGYFNPRWVIALWASDFTPWGPALSLSTVDSLHSVCHDATAVSWGQMHLDRSHLSYSCVSVAACMCVRVWTNLFLISACDPPWNISPFPFVTNHKAGEESSSDTCLITSYIDIPPWPALIIIEADVNARVPERSACPQRSWFALSF